MKFYYFAYVLTLCMCFLEIAACFPSFASAEESVFSNLQHKLPGESESFKQNPL